jgi:hypothetical protein
MFMLHTIFQDAELAAFHFSVSFAIRMRFLGYIISFCLLLLFSTNSAFGGMQQRQTVSSSFHFESKIHSVKNFNDYQNVILTEYTDVELEDQEDDEDRNKHKVSEKTSTNYFQQVITYSYIPSLDIQLTSLRQNTFLLGLACPLYISQRVLRI